MKIFLIFPTQLFKDITDYKEADEIFLIEEPLYFTLLYRGSEIEFDKHKMYENEKVIHWQY